MRSRYILLGFIADDSLTATLAIASRHGSLVTAMLRRIWKWYADSLLTINTQADTAYLQLNVPKLTPDYENVPLHDIVRQFHDEIAPFHRLVWENVIRRLFVLFAIILELPENYFVDRHHYDAPSEDHLRYVRPFLYMSILYVTNYSPRWSTIHDRLRRTRRLATSGARDIQVRIQSLLSVLSTDYLCRLW